MMLGKAEWWWIFDDAVEQIAKKLDKDNFVILDGFLGQDLAVELHQELFRAYRAGKLPETRHEMIGCPRMEPGALAGGQAGTSLTYRMKSVRGDHVAWFDGKESACKWRVLPMYLQRMDTMVSELAEHLPNLSGTGALRSNAMATCYPGSGAHYVRHCDNTSEIRNGRRLTALFYVNPLWKSGDGGELRMFAPQMADLPPEDDRAYTAIADISPVLDRAVLFYADERCPHEVLPTIKMRFAVTTWYFDKEEKLAANQAKTDETRLKSEMERTQREMAKFQAKYGELPEVVSSLVEKNRIADADSDDGIEDSENSANSGQPQTDVVVDEADLLKNGINEDELLQTLDSAVKTLDELIQQHEASNDENEIEDREPVEENCFTSSTSKSILEDDTESDVKKMQGEEMSSREIKTLSKSHQSQEERGGLGRYQMANGEAKGTRQPEISCYEGSPEEPDQVQPVDEAKRASERYSQNTEPTSFESKHTPNNGDKESSILSPQDHDLSIVEPNTAREPTKVDASQLPKKPSQEIWDLD